MTMRVDAVSIGNFMTMVVVGMTKMIDTMTIDDIKSNLCYYDSRNPLAFYDDRDEGEDERCYCDNCFYGRTELAEELIKLINIYQIT
jgi:hypothetical protein